VSPARLSADLVRSVPILATEEEVGTASRRVMAAGLPALPVARPEGTLHGIFGERELITALFPGYLDELRSAAFVPGSIDEVIDKRIECRRAPVGRYANTEAIAAGPGFSDVQLAETFLHHRVLIVPIVDGAGRVQGIVTRSEFFAALVERLDERS
jgi:CBS-domain-containing membrane protein